jgi:uncharacterized protein (DUF1697 family)
MRASVSSDEWAQRSCACGPLLLCQKPWSIRHRFRPVAAIEPFLMDSHPRRLLDEILRGGGIMDRYVALLRAVNIGGTGKLPMSDLKAICEKAGFGKVRTYVASGNVVFESREDEARVKATLETALAGYAGKPVGVLVRTASELAQVLANNPFPDAAPKRTAVIFLDEPPMGDALERITGKNGEDVRLGQREIYVHDGDGMANSKLKIPDAKAGTARNINTVFKLAGMVAQV